MAHDDGQMNTSAMLDELEASPSTSASFASPAQPHRSAGLPLPTNTDREDCPSVAGRAYGSGVKGNAIVQVSYTHDAMIDLILANPSINQNQIAKHFGYTPGWVSQVMSSDAFKNRLADRKNHLVDPLIAQELDAQLEGLARQAAANVRKRLEDNPNDGNFALRVLDMGTKALGFGARERGNSGPVVAPVQFLVVTPEKAASAEEWVRVHKPAGRGVSEVIDVTPTQVPSAGGDSGK